MELEIIKQCSPLVNIRNGHVTITCKCGDSFTADSTNSVSNAHAAFSWYAQHVGDPVLNSYQKVYALSLARAAQQLIKELAVYLESRGVEATTCQAMRSIESSMEVMGKVICGKDSEHV